MPLKRTDDPTETMTYSRSEVISIPSPWHIVGAPSKLYKLAPGVKNTTPPFSFLIVSSSTFPVNALLISQETNEELTSPVRD